MSKDKDKLLLIVDRLNQRFRIADKEHKGDYGNLLSKFFRFYLRHRKEKESFDKLISLMSMAPEKRGKNYVANWIMIRDNIKQCRGELDKLNPDDLAFVLGWLAKLAR